MTSGTRSGTAGILQNSWLEKKDGAEKIAQPFAPPLKNQMVRS